jgi:hypothetical protein
VRHSVFTVEVCARLDLAGPMLDQLLPIVRDAPERVDRAEAWRRHATAAEILLAYFDKVERGCWEYFDDERTARAMFDDWCRPLVERDVPRQTPSGVPTYRDAGPRYLAFTFVYLLAHGSPSDHELRRICNVAPGDLWRRGTFQRLLEAVRALSFASVKADAMYMTPRDEDWALTAADLASERFAYLRVLTP